MISECGIVKELAGDHAVVAVSADNCEGCPLAKRCFAASDGTTRLVSALNTAGAGVGDNVLITIKPGARTLAATLVYFIPALALVLGAVLGDKFNVEISPLAPALAPVVCGAAAFLAAFVVVVCADRLLARRSGLTVVIERRIEPGDGS